MMNWGERTLLLRKEHFPEWGKESAMLPTPIQLSPDVIRVYATFCDAENIGRIGYFDISSANPLEIIKVSKTPVLDIGKPGSFDDNGVTVCSVIKVNNCLYMYYAGFEICTNIRYRILTGLAISEDNGDTFQRISDAPILDRSTQELFFRCGPFVLKEDNVFKMWYIGGSSWITQKGKELPIYDMRYIESDDGIVWPSHGKIIIPITDSDEHGFGRPYVQTNQDLEVPYHLHYSIRKISHQAYRLGFATSSDGINWQRKDNLINLDVSKDNFDSKAIMFAAPILINGKNWLFYNGNDFGKDGIAIIPKLN